MSKQPDGMPAQFWNRLHGAMLHVGQLDGERATREGWHSGPLFGVGQARPCGDWTVRCREFFIERGWTHADSLASSHILSVAKSDTEHFSVQRAEGPSMIGVDRVSMIKAVPCGV